MAPRTPPPSRFYLAACGPSKNVQSLRAKRLLDIYCTSDTASRVSLMTKRLGRTLTSEHSARKFAYEAHLVGADRTPLAGNCQRPVILPITGFPDRMLFGLREGVENMDAIPDPRHVDLEVRCRKCENCLKARRQHWSMRAKAEIDASQRSWFGTLTLTPEKQFHLVATARSTLWRAGTKYDDLSPDEQFIETCKGLTREVQLYFKRLRKTAPPFRYLWTVERHKSGAPHVHMLIHEHAGSVRHRQLVQSWRWGFVKFNLVAEGQSRNAANYVAKYLTKSLVKLAASKQYGVDVEQRTKLNLQPPPPAAVSEKIFSFSKQSSLFPVDETDETTNTTNSRPPTNDVKKNRAIGPDLREQISAILSDR